MADMDGFKEAENFGTDKCENQKDFFLRELLMLIGA